MKKKITISLIILAVIVAVIAIYFAQKPKEPETIKIGAILPLTGPASDIGEWQRKGLEVAKEELNGQGGINEKKIEIIYEDSKGQPKEGVSAFRKIVEVQKIPVIFSSLSSVSNAIIPFIEKSQVPSMLIAVSFPGITEKSNWVFRNHPGSDDEALAMVGFVFNDMRLRNIVVLYCNDDFGIGGYEAFKRVFQKYGGKILFSDAFQLDQTDFRSIVTKVKNYKPEGVYVIGYTKASVLLVKQLREAGYKQFLAAPMAMSIPTFLELASGGLEGAYFTNTIFDPYSEDFKTKNFVERFRKMFNTEPNVFAGFAYDGLMMIGEAIKKKGYTRLGIREGLLEIKNFQGVMGILKVSEGRNIKFPLRIVKLEKGNLIPVKSP